MKIESLDILFEELYKLQIKRDKCSNNSCRIEIDMVLYELADSIENRLQEIKLNVLETD